MSNSYRVPTVGNTYFFTLVTHDRYPWLCHELARTALRAGIIHVRQKYPFAMDACVLLPNHLHCIWTLPESDHDYATRWKLIKSYVTRRCGKDLMRQADLRESRQNRQEGNLWQRGVQEHPIQNAADFVKHCDYIHYNPVRHGLCNLPQEWEFSSIHRFVEQGIYHVEWGKTENPSIETEIWDIQTN